MPSPPAFGMWLLHSLNQRASWCNSMSISLRRRLFSLHLPWPFEFGDIPYKHPKVFVFESHNGLHFTIYVRKRIVSDRTNDTSLDLFGYLPSYCVTLLRSPDLDFIRPFRCPVTILNTLDHQVKFERKADEGFLVGYFVNYKAFRVFNSRTKKVEENLHITFLENKSNVAGRGLVGQEKASDHEYILLPFMPSHLPLSLSIQSSDDKDVDEAPGKGRSGSLNNNIVGSNDPSMPSLEETGIFNDVYDDREVGAEADTNNLELLTVVSPIPTTRMHKYHPREQIIEDLNLATQIRRMINFSKENAMVFGNKKDKRGIVIRNKARLVAQGYTQEEGIDYDEVFAHVPRIEAIRLFLAYASFIGFIVYQMDVKSAFLYGTIEEEVYLLEPGMKYCLPNFWKMDLQEVKQKDDGIFISQDKYVADILKMFDFAIVKTASTPMEPNKALIKDAEAKDVTPKTSHLYVVKRIFRYLKGQPKLGFWYPRDSPFDLEAFFDSYYAGASLDRKSTIGGCQFLGKKLISWQCKKQTIVANSTTEAEYVAVASCYGQVLWIQN
nr:hypothetical protein [Tanacetum cinerariifolium]